MTNQRWRRLLRPDDGARVSRRRASRTNPAVSGAPRPGLAPGWGALAPDAGNLGLQRLVAAAPLFARLAGIRANPREPCPGCGVLAVLGRFVIEHYRTDTWQGRLEYPYVAACPACLYALDEAMWARPVGPWWSTPQGGTA